MAYLSSREMADRTSMLNKVMGKLRGPIVSRKATRTATALTRDRPEASRR